MAGEIDSRFHYEGGIEQSRASGEQNTIVAFPRTTDDKEVSMFVLYQPARPQGGVLSAIDYQTRVDTRRKFRCHLDWMRLMTEAFTAVR